LLAFVFTGALVTATATGAQTTSLQGNASPTLDDPNGAVAVVAAAAPVDGRVAFVVQNGTSRNVRISKVASVATSPDGGSVAGSSTSSVVPARLAPGETAIGQVRFRGDTTPIGASLKWKVESRTTATPADPFRLDVSDIVASPPLTGAVAQRLDFTLTNAHERARLGPFRVQVVCVNEAGRPAVGAARDIPHRRLGAGASLDASVSLSTLCPNYVMAATSRGQ
jgi:hypothetical protein